MLKATFLAASLASLVAPGVALAHKAKSHHTHCTMDGKGIEVSGKTDAERKTACAKLSGTQWNEAKALPVDKAATAAAKKAAVEPQPSSEPSDSSEPSP